MREMQEPKKGKVNNMNIEKFKKCVKAIIELDYRLAKAPQTPKSLENDLLVEIGTYVNVLNMLDDDSYLDATSEIVMKEGSTSAEFISIDELIPEIGRSFFFRFQKRSKKQTNADRIRAMTDEQLARWIADELIEPGYFNGDECYSNWLNWLKQEVEE